MINLGSQLQPIAFLAFVLGLGGLACGESEFDRTETTASPATELEFALTGDHKIVRNPQLNPTSRPTEGTTPIVEILRVTATSADIAFDVPTDTVEVHYGLREINQEQFQWHIETWQQETDPTYTFAPLLPTHDYALQLKVRTQDGQEGMSDILLVTTQDENPPNRLRFLVPNMAGQIPIAWDEIPGASHYEIYRSQREQDGLDFYDPCPESPPSDPPLLTLQGEFQAVDETVEPGFFYGYTVVGIARNGLEVSRLNCRWRASPLHRPEDLRAHGREDGQIEVTWQPSNQNADSRHAVWFHIEYRAGLNGIVEVVPINQSHPGPVLISSIDRNETHFIEVSAYPSISGEGVDDAIRFQQMGCQCRDFWSARIQTEVPPF